MMKTIQHIRIQLGLTAKGFATYLGMTELEIINAENGTGIITGQPLTILEKVESWLNAKPDFDNETPSPEAIKKCYNKLCIAKYKKYILENQLADMEETISNLNSEHTEAIRLCMLTSHDEYLHTAVMHRRLTLEQRMRQYSGYKLAELKMKIYFISAEIISLSKYLGRVNPDL